MSGGTVGAPSGIHHPHVLDNLVVFGRLLRRAGLRVSSEQIATLAHALTLIDVTRKSDVRAAARALLVTRREDLPVFDLLFNRFFRRGVTTTPTRAGMRRERARPGAAQQGTFTIENYGVYASRELTRELTIEDRRGTWSHLEVLRHRKFADLTASELEQLARMVRESPWRATLRRTRRLVRASGGNRLDLRRAMRRAQATAGLVFERPRRAPRERERPLILLADISGSMERYSRILLQFFHATLRARPHVEAFVFSTRLTYLTPQLRLRNVDQALAASSQTVADWAGGTRIGAAFRQFNRKWSRRLLRRGAVTVIVSDGLDCGDVGLLARELRWIRDRSWRVIWLNPLAGNEAYEPRAEGMAAARALVDEFLPAHNLAALEDLAATLRNLPSRRTARRSVQRPHLSDPQA